MPSSFLPRSHQPYHTLPGWRSSKWRGKSMSFPITYDFWCNNVLLLPATNGFYLIGSELVVSTWKRFLLVIPSPLSEKHLLKSRCRFHPLHLLHLDVWLFNIDRNWRGMNSPFQGSAAPHMTQQRSCSLASGWRVRCPSFLQRSPTC